MSYRNERNPPAVAGIAVLYRCDVPHKDLLYCMCTCWVVIRSYHMSWGFSTGTLRNSHSYEGAIALYRGLGCRAVEISPSHIFGVKERPGGFVYVSTHDAPPSPYARGDSASIERLLQLEGQVERLALDRVVLHPDRVDDWELIKEYSIPWAIENLDARNEHFKTPEELVPTLEEYDLPLVLDFNHCYTHDPSLALACRFQEQCGARIVEQHVSGYRDATAAGRHVPLHETRQIEMVRALDRTLPTIIEVDECSPEALARECSWFAAQLGSVT